MRLSAQAPFAGEALLRFLSLRAIRGVEEVDEASYQRVVSVGMARGVVRVQLAAGGLGITARVPEALAAHHGEIERRLRHLFDLDAEAAQIDAHLASVPSLAESVRERPGLRVPGAFDVWEMCARAVLGQQVSVKGASTLAGRLVERFGSPLAEEAAAATLRYVFPSAQVIAAQSPDQVRTIGMPLSRARTLVGLAELLTTRGELLAPGAELEHSWQTLQTVPGIGPWTASYIAMRSLKARDVFLSGDLGAKKALGVSSEREAERLSQHFRPYRAYALMHLWASL